MLRNCLIILASSLSSSGMIGAADNIIVADLTSRTPLPGASIFDWNGNNIGVTSASGQAPVLSQSAFPITIRYLGYEEHTVKSAGSDTIFLKEKAAELPEVVIESRQHKVLHMLAYVREYSTLSTYTDTVFLFREKMVDFMLPTEKKGKFKGWRTPRILKSRSYYRFTDFSGLDSVSNLSNYHFSWSDWIGSAPSRAIPDSLRNTGKNDWTIMGKFAPYETWHQTDRQIMVDVDVLADTTGRRWVPELAGFFKNNLDFEKFKIHFVYDNLPLDSVTPAGLTGYSYNIESRGRGHEMFKFNRINQQVFVETYAETYIIDKEYITVKEAKQWHGKNFSMADIEIYAPHDAPELSPDVKQLIARVENIDHDNVRLQLQPDGRLAGNNGVNKNYRIGNRFLNILKDLTGISSHRSKKKAEKSWKQFKQEWRDQQEDLYNDAPQEETTNR